MNRSAHDPEHNPEQNPEQEKPQREYEQSGLYPRNGRPFRILALLGGLLLVIVMLAGAASVVDWLVDY